MATARTIVTLALKKLGRVGSGREPRPVDATDGFEALIALYRGWINSGAFGRLRDVMPDSDYVALGNERIMRVTGAEFEVTLPEVVADWQFGRIPYGLIVRVAPDGTFTATGSQALRHGARPPKDLAPVVICDTETGNVADYIYDGAQKKWVPLWDIAIDDEAPLSFRNTDGLAACLAVNIADQFGADITATTAQSAAHYRSALLSGFSNPSRDVPGVYF